MATTRIDWADKVWNPITGCSSISPGCAHCYAARFAQRLAGRCGYPADKPFRVTFHPDRLEEPLHWRKPQTVFVCSMGDIFHHDVKKRRLQQVWRVMECCPQHRFLILTKRPHRMNEHIRMNGIGRNGWALPNVGLGVSVSNQREADKKLPMLLATPGFLHFVSVEPMLGPVDLARFLSRDPRESPKTWLSFGPPGPDGSGFRHLLNWVICGGETGPGARRLDDGWVNDLRQQCADVGVSFWFKQRNRHDDDILYTVDGPRTYKQTPWGDQSETDGATLRSRIECLQ